MKQVSRKGKMFLKWQLLRDVRRQLGEVHRTLEVGRPWCLGRDKSLDKLEKEIYEIYMSMIMDEEEDKLDKMVMKTFGLDK